MKNAVILFSGGVDSTTCLALAKSEGFKCYAISFNYRQKHAAELVAAKKIAKTFGAEHIIVDLLNQFCSSALTDKNQDVPDYKNNYEIPSTYVPARNTIFLSMALGWAEVLNADDLFIGASSIDYSGYPDCRPEYFEAFQTLANLATKAGVTGKKIKIHTPLIYLSKAETIQLGLSLGVDYQMTVSCYRADNDGQACGKCDSCTWRIKGFTEANIEDPTRYYTLE